MQNKNMSRAQPQYADVRVRVDEERGVVSVTDFSMSDPQVAEYFASQAPDQREDRLEAAIRAGVLALKSVDVGERVDYVKKEFGLLRADVEKKMDETVRDMGDYLGEGGRMDQYVGKEGKVFDVMEKYIGEGGEVSNMAKDLAEEWANTLRQSMDPRNKGSPLYEMRNDILEQLDRIRDGVAQRLGEERIEQKTPLKGREFEKYCLRKIGQIAHVTGDAVEDTSKTVGYVTNSKKGDLVVEVADTDARIVIEVRDVKDMSGSEALGLLDGSIDNRDADFGLLIVKNVEAFPSFIGWFHEFGSTDKLAVALGSASDDDARDGSIHSEILLIAYKWARARAVANALDEGSVDAKSITDKLDNIRHSLNGLSGIKRQVTAIQKAADKIRDTVGEVTDAANASLDDISVSLKYTGAE